MSVSYGIDVSYHNGPIDWARVKADGIEWATIKATSGEASGGSDSPAYFRAQAPAMARNTALCGGYHWLKPRAVTAVKKQVQTFLDVMDAGLGGYLGRIVQLDAEEDGLVPDDVTAWMDEWNTRSDAYPVAGYLPAWFESRWPGSKIGQFRFAAWWASRYVAGTGQPYLALARNIGATHWSADDGVTPAILQYTSTARVGGVTGNCDANQFRGTTAQLAAELTSSQEDDMSVNDRVPVSYPGDVPDADYVAAFSPPNQVPTVAQMLHRSYWHTIQQGKTLTTVAAAVARIDGLDDTTKAELDQALTELADVRQHTAALSDPDAFAALIAAHVNTAGIDPDALLDALGARLARPST